MSDDRCRKYMSIILIRQTERIDQIVKVLHQTIFNRSIHEFHGFIERFFT